LAWPRIARARRGAERRHDGHRAARGGLGTAGPR
jgi:hypothetical protein